jgi:hypothetical protein
MSKNALKLDFKEFLLNESRAYLGVRIGDILNGIQDLSQNAKAMGTRQMVRNSEVIVNQIRRILHSNWSKEDEKHLKQLQKVGVALAKAMEEKDDLEDTIAACQQALEDLSGDLGVPVNQLGSPEEAGEPQGDESQQSPPQGEEEEDPQQAQAQQGQPQDQQGQQGQPNQGMPDQQQGMMGQQPPQMPGSPMMNTPGGI